MRRLVAILASLLWATAAHAQLTQTQVQTAITENLPSCGDMCISASALRSVLDTMTQATFQFDQFPNTWAALQTYTAGISSVPAVPGTVTNNPGQYNCFFGSTIYCGNTTAISSVAPGFTSAGVSGITIGAPSGAAAGIFGAQCSLGTGVGYLACGPAVQCFIYADTTQANNNGISCGYSAAKLLATSDPVAVGGGRAYGYISHEFSVVNDWGYVATDPYNYNATGSVHGIRVDCGIGQGGHNNCGGAAYEVASNTELFGGGLLCGHGSLVTKTIFGVSGLGPCAAMDVGHGMFWYSAANTPSAGIYGLSGTPNLHLAVGASGQINFEYNGSVALGMNSTQIFPLPNNAVELGDPTLRWSSVNSVLGNFSGVVTEAGAVITSAAPTVSAGQIGYGSTVNTAGTTNCPATMNTSVSATQAVQGCLVINVAGTARQVPFFTSP